ncbi:signal peptidase I [Bacillus massiliglaciei]|uniref:signal peptidase I n=1 Tax=Bacillus massiliglaciei TaxID=1816693 RepID=UPI000A5C6531|nr:signal peptidase I [Bacillus massiliglaciei]
MGKSKAAKELFSWTKAIITAVLFSCVIRMYLFSPIVVDGESMMPTLQDEDKIILSKRSDIDRFDIVVFHATKEKDYIKRVIGMPGDHIEYKDDVLYINGKKYEEPYLDNEKKEYGQENLTEDFKLEDYTGAETVPENEYFVMGDNRRNSLDSRMIGTVSKEKITGQAEFLYWPMNDIQLIK